MTATGTWTGPEPLALLPLLEAAITRVLRRTATTFAAGADAAYAGTRFGGTFRFTPALPFREVRIFSTDPLLIVVEEPTRPHTITARNAPYLVFQVGGRWVRTRQVAHPGTPGKHWLDPLWERAQADLRADLVAAWEGLRA